MKDKRKVFYWNDTGPVEVTVEADCIVEAVSVETVTMVDGQGVIEELPIHWKAEK